MNRIGLLLVCLIFFYGATGQGLKKYDVGNSGCRIYTWCDPGTFKTEKSPDSSTVYTGNCSNGDTKYGIICIKLKEKIADLDASENVMISYLDFLKTSLKIKRAAGYGKGHQLRGKENTRGVIDYWNDDEEANWKVKAFTDGNFIAVLYVCSKKEIVESKANLYLDGFLLPGM